MRTRFAGSHRSGIPPLVVLEDRAGVLPAPAASRMRASRHLAQLPQRLSEFQPEIHVVVGRHAASSDARATVKRKSDRAEALLSTMQADPLPSTPVGADAGATSR